MSLFADLVLSPNTIVAWIVVGMIASWLAGKMMEPPSYGMMGDMVVGAIGGVVGACLFGVMVAGEPSFWFSVLIAALGAAGLIAVARAITARWA